MLFFRLDLRPPTITQEGKRWYIILAPLQEERRGIGLGGLFSKSSNKKVILPDGFTMETAKFLANMINELQHCQENHEPVIMKMIQQKSS